MLRSLSCSAVLLVAVTALAPMASAQHARRHASPTWGTPTAPEAYVVDFVSPAAFGVDLGDSGTVIGRSYTDIGCGPFCLPPLETVAWHGGTRTVLPELAGYPGITLRQINGQGLIVGYAGFNGTSTRATLWRPAGDGYEFVDLGTLPGTTISEAIGIDERGRVIGWSTTPFFPPTGGPFLWTEAGGMVDLRTLGFPGDRPLAISPGGTVATPYSWYRLDDPASVTPMAPTPSGFLLGADTTAINGAGDQARFLISTSSQSLRYLFRYHHEGSYQQLSAAPSGSLTRYGVGSIDPDGTITATVQSTGVIAPGPDGTARTLASLLAAPYGYPDPVAPFVTTGGPRNASGEILASVIFGREDRLVRLVPATPCLVGCLRVEDLVIDAVRVDDPTDPGHCSPELNARSDATVTLTVRDAAGNRVPGATVLGRFLDDYWTNRVVSGVTDGSGDLVLTHSGPCGVGALEFFVDDVRLPGHSLDRTAGSLVVWAIPHP